MDIWEKMYEEAQKHRNYTIHMKYQTLFMPIML
ncbi:Uncharacterised protein [Streptococcus pneumoniae]|nr:Uncharacterised protein [Streptococcus pneumoniae]